MKEKLTRTEKELVDVRDDLVYAEGDYVLNQIYALKEQVKFLARLINRLRYSGGEQY